MRQIICGIVYPEPEGVACKVCNDRGFIVLEVIEVKLANLRWQWADLGPGVNDCPCCDVNQQETRE